MSSYSVNALRVADVTDSELTGSKLIQPNSKFKLKYLDNKAVNIDMTAEKLIAKVIKASGGEKNIRKLTSRVTKYEIYFVNQEGYGTKYTKAPNKAFYKITLTAQNKEVGYIAEYFDGKRGFFESNLYPTYEYEYTSKSLENLKFEYTGKSLENLKFRANFHDFLDLNERIEKAEILRKDKLAGEDVYVLSVNPKRADKVTYFISAKTFLVLRGDYILVPPSSPSASVNMTLLYEDYKKVDGVVIPFKVTRRHLAWGIMSIMFIREVKHNVKIPDSMFRKQAN